MPVAGSAANKKTVARTVTRHGQLGRVFNPSGRLMSLSLRNGLKTRPTACVGVSRHLFGCHGVSLRD
jgi:hypothetical protein